MISFQHFLGPDLLQDTPIVNTTEVEDERNMKCKNLQHRRMFTIEWYFMSDLFRFRRTFNRSHFYNAETG